MQAGEYTIEDVTITLFEERDPEPEPEPELEPEPEKEPELQPEPEEEPEPEPETEPEKEPEFFYIQPAVEIGAAMGIFFRVGLALDAGFLVKTVNNNANIYVGIDFDLKLWPSYTEGSDVYPIFSFPVLASTVFDIMLPNQPELKSISIRISAGPDMWLGRGRKEEDVTDVRFWALFAWGAGFDLVFKNDVVFKFGIDSYLLAYPDLVAGVGYRF